MPSVTIDAGALALPSAGSTPEELHNFTKRVMDCRNLLSMNGWLKLYTNGKEAMHLDGLAPDLQRLKTLFRAAHVEHVSPNDLVRVVKMLLERCHRFEESFDIDVLAEEIAINPDILSPPIGASGKLSLERCLVLLAVLGRYCDKDFADHFLVVRHTCGNPTIVQARIKCIDHKPENFSEVPLNLKSIRGKVLVYDNLTEFIKCVDEAELLLKADGRSEFVMHAIRIAVFKLQIARGKAPQWGKVPENRIHKDFTNRLQSLGPTPVLARSVLRAIVETLHGSNMRDTHALRTSSAGNAPQRTRSTDGATAWRRDIDRDHHLHYWKLKSGIVELASVSDPHDDFDIPE